MSSGFRWRICNECDSDVAVYYAKLPPGVKTIPPPPPQKAMDTALQESVENRLAQQQMNKASGDAEKKGKLLPNNLTMQLCVHSCFI